MIDQVGLLAIGSVFVQIAGNDNVAVPGALDLGHDVLGPTVERQKAQKA